MSERKLPVRLMRSTLTGRVYALTRYTEKDGLINASVKHDVTEDFDALVEQVIKGREAVCHHHEPPTPLERGAE